MFAGRPSPTNNPSVRVRPKQRASHTKSRNGCYTCKQRRVKCDEVRPVCGACSLRNSDCSFPSRSRSSPNRRIIARSEESSEPGTSFVPSDTWHRAFRCSVSGPTGPPKHAPTTLDSTAGHGNGAINMTDLKLLHHFMSNISGKLSFSPGKTHAWKCVVPAIAAENAYIMHLLLALTGLDMLCKDSLTYQSDTNDLDRYSSPAHQGTTQSDSEDNDDYLSTVIEHHSKGIQGFMEELKALSESNAETLFSGSLLLVAFAFASLRVKNLDLIVGEQELNTGSSIHDTPSPESTLALNEPRLDWLYLVRGLTSIIEQQWTKLRTGPLRQMMVFSNAKDGEVLGKLVESVPANLPHRMGCFAQGAHQAITRLKAFSKALKSTAHSATNESVSRPQEIQEQTRRPLTETEFIEEQESAIDMLDEMYIRIKAVLLFSDSGTNGSAHIDLQGELEDAAIMAWPHMFSHGFVASLEPREGLEVLRCHSFAILAHAYTIGALFETLWYAAGSFEREILKINNLTRNTGNSQLVYLMQFPMQVIAARTTAK